MRAALLWSTVGLVVAGCATPLIESNPGACPECGCVDLARDPAHCGACGAACGSAEFCYQGACVVACPVDLVACARSCFDTRNDPSRCGDCATSCGPGGYCAAGACVSSCPSPTTACWDVVGWERCVDTAIEENHCGGCNRICSTNSYCDAGACLAASPVVVGVGCDPTATVDWCDGATVLVSCDDTGFGARRDCAAYCTAQGASGGSCLAGFPEAGCGCTP